MSDYEHFVRRKLSSVKPTGIASGFSVPSTLFPHQSALTAWALRRGRAAIFADTGLGKSRMQLAWADAVRRHTKRPVLILAPLAVAAQTEQEGRAIGIEATHCRDGAEAPGCGIVITNYDRAHLFDLSKFTCVILDESSILKHYSKTFFWFVEACKNVPFRLCFTATPAPNDFVEFGNHSLFLGLMHFKDVLARWFVGEGDIARSARLKHHAREDFWRWLTSWAVCISKPVDLGKQYDMAGYDLPPMHAYEHRLAAPQASIDRAWKNGVLLPDDAATATSFHKVKRESLAERVNQAVEIVSGVSDSDPIILWCHTDYEADALRKAFPSAIEVRGSQKPKQKEDLLTAFSDGKERIIITKPSIAGMGLNWQHCNRAIYVGVDFSFETTYQSMGRIHRFGQERDVHFHFIYAETEGSIMTRLKKKQDAFARMQVEMSFAMQQHGLFRESAAPAFRSSEGLQPLIVPAWLQTKAG